MPYAGTWIEIRSTSTKCPARSVVPYAGTWIEMSGRGGSSGWSAVVPYAGTWIEIGAGALWRVALCRALRGHVD